jgi:hypothetical protein
MFSISSALKEERMRRKIKTKLKRNKGMIVNSDNPMGLEKDCSFKSYAQNLSPQENESNGLTYKIKPKGQRNKSNFVKPRENFRNIVDPKVYNANPRSSIVHQHEIQK